MKIFSNKKFLIIIISLVLIIIISIYFFTKDTEEIALDYNDFYLDNSTIEDAKPAQIAIHITGEVNSPGIIYLDINSRIADAIEFSGGPTELADLSKVNLAYELKDGQKIYIPSIYDENTSNYINANAGENVLDNSIETEKMLININSATQNELENLSGIGESTAKKIIEYRSKNGKFKAIEDLMNVPGIGKSKFNNIKDYICI